MRKLFPLLAFCVLAPACFAAQDEAQLALKSCGKPLHDRQRTTASGEVDREITYRDVSLGFVKRVDGWQYSLATDGERHLYSASGVAVIKPCLQRMSDAVLKRGPADAPTKPEADPRNGTFHAGSSSDSSVVGMMIVLAFLLAIAVVIVVVRRNAWRKRPQRLCTNWYVQAQPLQHKNKRWYCGHCGADNPAPLDSPLAQAFHAKQQATTQPKLEA